jgi:hypothetical protein
VCTTIAGQFGNAISLNDVSSCVRSIAHDTDLQGPEFTVEAWFKFVGAAGTGVGRFGYERPGEAEYAWRIELVGNTPTANEFRIRCKVKTTAAGEVTVFTHDMTEDTNWHHVAWVYNTAGNTTLYVDNVAVSTIAAPVASVAMETGESYFLILIGNTNWAFDNIYFGNAAHTLGDIDDHFTNGV